MTSNPVASGLRTSSVFMPLKKALIPQKSACFQSLDGWSWHWVH